MKRVAVACLAGTVWITAGDGLAALGAAAGAGATGGAQGVAAGAGAAGGAQGVATGAGAVGSAQGAAAAGALIASADASNIAGAGAGAAAGGDLSAGGTPPAPGAPGLADGQGAAASTGAQSAAGANPLPGSQGATGVNAASGAQGAAGTNGIPDAGGASGGVMPAGAAGTGANGSAMPLGAAGAGANGGAMPPGATGAVANGSAMPPGDAGAGAGGGAMPPGAAGASANGATGPAAGNGPPYEMRFRFEHRGTPSPHTFVLKWDRPDATLKSIDVLVADTPEVLQTLAIPPDKIHLIWQDLQGPGHAVKDKILDYKDFNFDSYGDLSLTQTWPYKVGEKYYLIWLFNPQKNLYEVSAALTALPAPVPDQKTQRIESLTLGAYGGGEYVDRSFSITPAGVLQLELKITQTVADPWHLNFWRDVRLREKGNLHRICKIRVPAEGKPRRVSGDKKLCGPFLEKGAPKYMQQLEIPKGQK